MKKYIAIIALFLGCIQFARAETVSFDQETYTREFQSVDAGGNKIKEFLRKGDTLDKWQKLIAFRSEPRPDIGNDPKVAAQVTEQNIKNNDPNALDRIIVNNAGTEAVMDFLVWSPDNTFVELNVFRYLKSEDGKRVISMQAAYRVNNDSPDIAEKIKQLRTSWVGQIVKYDKKLIYKSINN